MAYGCQSLCTMFTSKHFMPCLTLLQLTYHIVFSSCRYERLHDRTRPAGPIKISPLYFERLCQCKCLFMNFIDINMENGRCLNLFWSDSLQGKLLYCHPPPHINPKDFQPQHARFARRNEGDKESTNDADKPSKVKRIENTVDKNFFHQVRFIH